MAEIDPLFKILVDKGGSDLHLAEGQPIKIRLHGEIQVIREDILTHEEMGRLMKEICDQRRWQRYLHMGDMDFAYSYEDIARFRANYYMQASGYGCIFRTIPARINTLEELGVPTVLTNFAHMRTGLVLITGPTGSGKSTTLAAIIDYINENQKKKILTIEEPIEFVHQNKKSILVQREVGIDCHSFADALESSTRQDLDVILVGEMRDQETIALALTAAEMGTLVFGTLHTNSAAKTIDRIIDTFPAEQQSQVRVMLSSSLRGVVSQLLVKTKDGKGRLPVNEIMLEAPGLGNLIREGKIPQIEGIIQQGKAAGMQFMDDCLWDLVQDDKISGIDAYMKSKDKGRFEALI
ncbi:MAG: type IV pili twitching motility protein PilT [Planctomycetota bacterium]|nr:MAG: type IV pili twitching motility protein PilT [Planctomycetota bacterium]